MALLRKSLSIPCCHPHFSSEWRRPPRAACELLTLMRIRSEEHTSELQSLMRISYVVFCLKKHKNTHHLILTHNRPITSVICIEIKTFITIAPNANQT